MHHVPISIILLTLTLGTATGQDGEKVVVEGEYHEKNLYVNNPMSESGVGFCVNEVRVNGDISSDEWNSSAFEVDLANFNLEPGEEVIIEISHKDDCNPKVLNPNVLKPRATFNVEEIEVTDEELLKWKASNENGRLPYKIQQFKWNKWVTVGEIQGNGTPGEHEYSFEVNPVPGENRFRVKQEGMDGKEKVSSDAEYVSSEPEIEYDYSRKEEEVSFSQETDYELYNMYGELVKKGFGKEVDLGNFEDGTYYLNYGGQTTEFKKR